MLNSDATIVSLLTRLDRLAGWRSKGYATRLDQPLNLKKAAIFDCERQNFCEVKQSHLYCVTEAKAQFTFSLLCWFQFLNASVAKNELYLG